MEACYGTFYKLTNDTKQLDINDENTYDFRMSFFEAYLEIYITEKKHFGLFKRKAKTLKLFYDEIIGMHIYGIPYMEIEMAFKADMKSEMASFVDFNAYLTGMDQQMVDFLNGHPLLMSKFYCENAGPQKGKRAVPLITPGDNVFDEERRAWFENRAKAMKDGSI